jgi:hypothetical protein
MTTNLIIERAANSRVRSLLSSCRTSNAEGSAIKAGWTAGRGIAGIVPNNARLIWKGRISSRRPRQHQFFLRHSDRQRARPDLERRRRGDEQVHRRSRPRRRRLSSLAAAPDRTNSTQRGGADNPFGRAERASRAGVERLCIRDRRGPHLHRRLAGRARRQTGNPPRLFGPVSRARSGNPKIRDRNLYN